MARWPVTDWLITAPAWADRCAGTFVANFLPAARAALAFSGSTARFLIHTDRPDKLRAAMDGLDVEFRPVPLGRTPHHMLGAAHKEAIADAAPGEAVAFLCADMVLSVECFAAAERRFDAGSRLIMASATRTIGGDPPTGVRSRDLLAWSMEHKHPITLECFWKKGRASVPWAIYFQDGPNTVLRAFHLHPFAALMDGRAEFKGTTVDFDLAAAFRRDEIHVVTDADELAMVEMSPASRTLPLREEKMTTLSIAQWAAHRTIDVHRWFFQNHEIVITGRGGTIGEQPLCDEIVRKTLIVAAGGAV